MLGIAALGQTPRVSRAAALAPGSFIGVGIQEVDSERAKTLKLGQEGGVEGDCDWALATITDPEERAAIAARARERAEQLFRLDRMITETAAAYEAVITGKAAPGTDSSG